MAPGRTLAHDLEHSHRILVSRLRLQSGAHNAKACQGLPDDQDPLNMTERVARALYGAMGCRTTLRYRDHCQKKESSEG